MTGKGGFPTLSDLKAALKSRGFRPSKSRGQNFLFDHNTLRIISAEIAALPEDTVLEIGPGSGFLTMHLAPTAGRILAVELDSMLSAVARSFVKTNENVEFMNTDILKKDGVNPVVLKRLRDLGGCSVVAGNLPYSAATAIIYAIACSDLTPRQLVFLLQEEVACRLSAHPGSPDYCAASVITMATYDAELLHRIGPNVFWPKPRVNSRLIRFRPAQRVPNLRRFAAFAHALFARPKKTAVNSFVEGVFSLPEAIRPRHEDNLRDAVTTALRSLEIDPRIRPGRLDFLQIEALYGKLVPEILT